ncbi:hypothetical protein AM1_C0263 (plasmid) [Acaryochloris marina MBIC11017]|uniref:Uncharacterized protein n=1 Tax=Acaryochloris marina (strain MBIC 11017) TaxID=329726 RepID=A8ZMZ4_ACAM1|nr:hypothetical protein AM1_C0263 [Acaryochloris marina MBIC11017]
MVEEDSDPALVIFNTYSHSPMRLPYIFSQIYLAISLVLT